MSKARIEFCYYPTDNDNYDNIEFSTEVSGEADIIEMFDIWKIFMYALGYNVTDYILTTEDEILSD